MQSASRRRGADPHIPCEVMWNTVVVPVGVDELTEKSGVVGAGGRTRNGGTFAHGVVVPMPTLPEFIILNNCLVQVESAKMKLPPPSGLKTKSPDPPL